MNINMNKHIIMGSFLELAPLAGGEDGAAGGPPAEGGQVQVTAQTCFPDVGYWSVSGNNLPVRAQAIQHTEGTKDVPSGKGGWHRPVTLEYARPWNMRCRSPPNLISRAM